VLRASLSHNRPTVFASIWRLTMTRPVRLCGRTSSEKVSMNRAESSVERSNDIAMRVDKGFVMLVMIGLALTLALPVRV
jgi:hypothetical protein